MYIAFHEYAYNHAYRGVNMLVNMIPQSDGVWEFKTDDSRMLGWFYRRRVFIAHYGAWKANINMRAARASVKRFRTSLRLPTPVFHHVSGGTIRDYL